MGIVKAFQSSIKKTKAMKSLIEVLSSKANLDNSGNDFFKPVQDLGDINIKIDRTYDDFFDVLIEDAILGKVINKYNVTKGQLREISDRYVTLGFGWEKSNYIPVSVLSFYTPLNYLLENIGILESGTYEDAIGYFYNAVRLLC